MGEDTVNVGTLGLGNPAVNLGPPFRRVVKFVALVLVPVVMLCECFICGVVFAEGPLDDALLYATFDFVLYV